MRRLLGVLPFLVLFTGCASWRMKTVTTDELGAEMQASAPARLRPLQLASLGSPVPPQMKIQPGDMLDVTVSGLRPGLYHVHVDSPQGTYDGDLMVRNVPVANVSLAPPPLVTLMLAPAHPPCPEEERERCREGLALEELEAAEAAEAFGGPGLLFPILGLTAGAAAIALPIALSHHHHRASP